MKAVIFAGGRGTRFSEKTQYMPKPMIEIGGKPILWHIMKIYAAHGINEFIICCGYKGYVIKEYFMNLANKLTIFRIILVILMVIISYIHYFDLLFYPHKLYKYL